MARLTADQWETVRAEREAGASFRDLASKHGVSHQAIVKRAKTEGWGDGQDVGETVRRKVAEKVAGVVASGNPKKKAAAIDAAAAVGAAVLLRQQQDWQCHRELFGAIPDGFEEGKHAKISAEMLAIRHKGERLAYRLDAPEEPGVARSITVEIVRVDAAREEGEA